jgi:hypothetical protein
MGGATSSTLFAWRRAVRLDDKQDLLAIADSRVVVHLGVILRTTSLGSFSSPLSGRDAVPQNRVYSCTPTTKLTWREPWLSENLPAAESGASAGTASGGLHSNAAAITLQNDPAVRADRPHLPRLVIHLDDADSLPFEWTDADAQPAGRVRQLGTACDPLPGSGGEHPTAGVGDDEQVLASRVEAHRNDPPDVQVSLHRHVVRFFPI